MRDTLIEGALLLLVAVSFSAGFLAAVAGA
jgi:hypothetical protein